MLTAKSVVLLSSRPSWVPGRVRALWDFSNDRYYPRKPVFGRASEGWAQNAAGLYLRFLAGAPRRTDKGLLVEPAATNKSTSTNYNPTTTTGITKIGDAAATVTLVDDVAALAAAGLDQICSNGKVYKFDNSLGAASAYFIFNGGTGSGQSGVIHASSVFLRGSTCSLALRNNSTGATVGGSNVVPESAGYVRQTRLSAPDTSSRQTGLQLAPGAVVYAILNQLELALATSPILIAGAAASRAADDLDLVLPGGLCNLVFTFDDGSTQTITGQSGTYRVPANLNRPCIRSISAEAA